MLRGRVCLKKQKQKDGTGAGISAMQMTYMQDTEVSCILFWSNDIFFWLGGFL